MTDKQILKMYATKTQEVKIVHRMVYTRNWSVANSNWSAWNPIWEKSGF